MKRQLLVAFVAGACATAVLAWVTLPQEGRQDPMPLEPPPALAEEHQEIHEELVKATMAEGAVGDAARAVAKVLHAHFVREEEIAMPQLGLLEPVSQGKITPDMKAAVKLSDQLKQELPQMLKEHVAIKAAVEELEKVAREAQDVEAERLARKLSLHARNEEQVLYPAAILLGEYLKLKLQ